MRTLKVFGRNIKQHKRSEVLLPIFKLWFVGILYLSSCSQANQSINLPSIEARDALSEKAFLTAEPTSDTFKNVEDGYPIITVTPSLICEGMQFINGEGVLLEGTKKCAPITAVDLVNLKPENIKIGVVIGDVTGTDPDSVAPSDCSVDGQVNCRTTSAFPAITADLISSSFLLGSTIAGVAGTVIAESHSNCASDGQMGCAILGPTYAAALTTGAADKIIVGQSLGGITGNIIVPSPTRVLTGTTYGIAGTTLLGSLSLPLPADVKAGTLPYGEPGAQLIPAYNPDFPSLANVRGADTVNGSAGTLNDCAAADLVDCVATASFKTMDLSAAGTHTGITASNFATLVSGSPNFEFWDALGARHSVAGDPDLTAAKILSGETIFSVTGTVTPAPAACSANGSQTCVASGSYFAATACSANSSNCFLPVYVASTQVLKAISYDAIDAGKGAFLSSLTLSGIQGTLGACTAGNQSGCIATTTYKTLDLTNASAMTDLSNGNFNTSIKTAGNFEFWDSTGTRHQVAGDVDLVAANIKNSELIFGLTGALTATPPTCITDGEANCLVDGASYAAGAIVGGADRILAGQTHAGVSGNVTLPAVGRVLDTTPFGVAGTSLTGTLTLPLAADVKTGSAAYGEPSAQRTPAYSPDFPTVANVRAADTVDGVAGTLNDCSAANQSTCVSTSSFKTIDLSAASGLTDLTSATFNTTIAGAGNFEFWDSAGNRYQVSGDSDLSAANILNSANIFGVAGSAIATPADCNTANQSGCVATATFKTMDLTTVGTQTGLSSANFNATIKTAANFEFWDASGARHSVAGDSDLAAANIENLVTIFGTTGTAVLEAHSPCTAANQSGCVATSTYKTLDLNLASGGTTDLTASTFDATLATAANFEFWDSSGARYVVSGDADLAAANILSGVSIFGATGSVTASPGTCSANGTQNCVASGSYFAAAACTANGSACYLPPYVLTTQALKAISYDAIDAGKALIRDSLSLAGITGTLANCSAANQAGCVATDPYRTLDLSAASGGMTDLSASNFNTTLATTAAFEFWDSAGGRHQVSGTSSLSVGNIKSGITIFGATGQYPSASYPLPSASATADLDAATFNAKLKVATAFEYWDSAGNYQTGAGDSDLVDSNIVSPIDIFGTTGSLSAGVSPNAWDVRVGTVINGVTGLSKLNCRNRASSSIWDMGTPQAVTVTTGNPGTINLTAHGFSANQMLKVGGTTAPTGLTLVTTTYYVRNPTSNTFELSTTSGGASVNISGAGTNVYITPWADGTANWWDTVDNYINNGLFPTVVVNGWSEDTACGKEVWEDLTTGGCSSAAADCVIKDRISGLQWSESYPVTGTAAASTAINWYNAIALCNGLNFGGQTDWRLPTQMEAQAGYAHGIRNVGYSGGTARPSSNTLDNNDYFILNVDSVFWTSSTGSGNSPQAWAVNASTGYLFTDPRNTLYLVACVR